MNGLVIENAKNIDYYNMDTILNVIKYVIPDYNWLITDVECHTDFGLFQYNENPFGCDTYFIDGENILDYLTNIEFIWGVFSAIPKNSKLNKSELLEICEPFANGNEELWEPSKTIQHKLAEIEIDCIDCSLTIIKAKDESIINRFSSIITNAKDLESYIIEKHR